ncbi:hypothetical protein MKX03_004562 [Papaver bracteatum]|nr:hypothetical protein MKX03_004562 [Papaver bracteatum]
MSKLHLLFLQWFLPFMIFADLFIISNGDVGTAARYGSPYIPSACFGNDQAQFPTSNLFGSAGEGIWDNGASCGREYLVRCISSSKQQACISGVTIQIKIVDRENTSVSRPSSLGTTIVLSEPAFSMIADASASTDINIDFQLV